MIPQNVVLYKFTKTHNVFLVIMPMLNYYKLWYYNYSNRKQKERNGEKI